MQQRPAIAELPEHVLRSPSSSTGREERASPSDTNVGRERTTATLETHPFYNTVPPRASLHHPPPPTLLTVEPLSALHSAARRGQAALQARPPTRQASPSQLPPPLPLSRLASHHSATAATGLKTAAPRCPEGAAGQAMAAGPGQAPPCHSQLRLRGLWAQTAAARKWRAVAAGGGRGERARSRALPAALGAAAGRATGGPGRGTVAGDGPHPRWQRTRSGAFRSRESRRRPGEGG